MPTAIKQDVVAVWYDAQQRDLWTQFGDERIYSLRQIAQRLATDGWRITSTLPLTWAIDASVAGGSASVVTELALFIAKDA